MFELAGNINILVEFIFSEGRPGCVDFPVRLIFLELSFNQDLLFFPFFSGIINTTSLKERSSIQGYTTLDLGKPINS